jgi:hypothetical protein
MIVETDPAFGGREQALARRTLRHQHIVALKFDVEVVQDIARGRHRPDGRAVDEISRRDENAIEIEKMLARKVEIAARHTRCQCVLRDPYRNGALRPCRTIAPDSDGADPADRAFRAAARDDDIADRKIFDGYLACGGQQPRAATEAMGVRRLSMPGTMPRSVARMATAAPESLMWPF